MIFSSPLQFGQCSRSRSKTRLSSLAQLSRIGLWCAQFASHSTGFLIGNDRQPGSHGEPLAVHCALHLIKKGCAIAMNRIQFQPGLSMPEFFKRYGSESQCAVALQTAR